MIETKAPVKNAIYRAIKVKGKPKKRPRTNDNFTSPNPIPLPFVTKKRKEKKANAPKALKTCVAMLVLLNNKYMIKVIRVTISNLSGIIPYSMSAKNIPMKE